MLKTKTLSFHAFMILRAQRAGKHRIETHAKTGGQRHHQVLHRECHAQRGQRIFADARNEHRVNDVIQRQHQHRSHHRQAHAPKQSAYGHHAHFVFLSIFHFILQIQAPKNSRAAHAAQLYIVSRLTRAVNA